MAAEVFRRYEKKYLLNTSQYEAILKEIAPYAQEDAFSRSSGFYSIQNIYYDTLDDALIRTSLDKPVYKEKLRLRSYGTPILTDQVFLEIKKKYKSVVSKRRISLPLEEAYDYTLQGIRPREEGINPQILKEMDFFLQTYPVVPKIYLSYERKAMAGVEDPQLRITFDRNITARRDHLRLELGSFGYPLLPEGSWLMEIKVLGAMPLWLSHILNKYLSFPTSFSKYGTEYTQYITHLKDKGESIYVGEPLTNYEQHLIFPA